MFMKTDSKAPTIRVIIRRPDYSNAFWRFIDFPNNVQSLNRLNKGMKITPQSSFRKCLRTEYNTIKRDKGGVVPSPTLRHSVGRVVSIRGEVSPKKKIYIHTYPWL